MSIKIKFILAVLSCIIIVMLGAAWNLNNLQAQVLEREARNRSEMVLNFTHANRNYVKKQLRPVVEKITDKMIFEAMSSTFATRNVIEIFNEQMPEYIYKQATTNPLNPLDKTNTFEQELIDHFKENEKLEELTGYTKIGDEERFYLARPIKVEASCLDCHGNPANVRKEIVQRYGTENGYWWQVGDIISALMIYVPTQDLRAGFSSTLQTLWGTFVALIVMVSLLIYFWFGKLVGRRLKRVAHVMSRTAANPGEQAEIRDKSKDEIGIVATAFNQMSASLHQLYNDLEGKVRQRTAQLAQANDEIIALNEKLKEENLRMGAELNVARQLQQMVLPNPEELDSIEGIELAGFMDPADEVGGDYYDVLHTEGVVTIGIGDVTGHGLESGILMLMTQTAVRTLQEIKESDPVRFLDTLNRTIYKNVQRMNSEKNLTLAVLNYSEGRVSISGQHEETLVVRSGGQIERIDTMDLGLPIGIDDDIADFIDHTFVELNSGDGVVLYTDGIPEAFDINKKQYGMERLCEVISHNWQHNAQEIKQAVIDDVRAFIGEQKVFDDITLVVLKQQ